MVYSLETNNQSDKCHAPKLLYPSILLALNAYPWQQAYTTKRQKRSRVARMPTNCHFSTCKLPAEEGNPVAEPVEPVVEVVAFELHAPTTAGTAPLPRPMGTISELQLAACAI